MFLSEVRDHLLIAATIRLRTVSLVGSSIFHFLGPSDAMCDKTPAAL